jgi:arylsulfatase A-like enzyme
MTIHGRRLYSTRRARNQKSCASFCAVKKESSNKTWVGLVVGLILVVSVLSLFVEIRDPNEWDFRERGSIDDIRDMSTRDDLNVLFIVVDTLRAEHLGSYGYPKETSPLLDEIAASGIRFDRHLAQSTWTKASMASLWTGLNPVRTGIRSFDNVIPDEAQMAAEIFSDEGFATVGLYRNGWVAPTFGFGQGFDVYLRPAATAVAPEVRRKNPTLTDRDTDAGIVEAASEFLRVNGRERWFLYVHLMDLHEYLYDEESALFGSSNKGIYDNSLRWTDGTIRVLVQALSDLDLVDQTLIAIASDHGEAFLERGFEGHARRVFRETTEVPFLLSFPFRLDPGIVIADRTRNIDIWPTIFDLLGIATPGELDGRSRMPDILAAANGTALDREPEISIAELNQFWAKRDREPLSTIAVSEETLRYVRVDLETGGAPIESLYDSRDDPLETHNLAKEDPETLERLRAVAEEYEQSEPSWGDAPTREISELELNLLRALGYAVP